MECDGSPRCAAQLPPRGGITWAMAMRRITSGQLLIATGVLHQAVGLLGGLGIGEELGGRNLFAELARGGVVDSIGSDFARMAWFWFLITGFVLLMLGGLVHTIERRGEPLPASLGWQMGALAIAGAAFIPVSGFWLLIPQAGWIVLRARRLGSDGRPRAPGGRPAAPTASRSR